MWVLYDYTAQIVSQQDCLCFPSTLSGQVVRLPGAGTETPSATGDTRAMRLLVTHVEKGLGALRTDVLDALTATAARGDLRVTMALATASEDPRPHLRRCVALQCLARHVDFDQHRKTGLHQGLLQILLH